MRFRIPMNVHQNGPPETITRAELTLHRADAMETITLTAVGESLQRLGAEPDSLAVETCTGPEGQQVCASGQTLTLTPGASYSGAIEVFNDVTGENVMGEIMDEAVWHQFVYLADSEVTFTITDTDVVGMPLGFSFEVTAPAEAVSTSLRIILDHYGRFEFKLGVRSRETDLDFSVPLSVP